MTAFIVEWVIDIEADTHAEAAEKALAIQRDRNSTALLFHVTENTGDMVRGIIQIDLSEEDDDD